MENFVTWLENADSDDLSMVTLAVYEFELRKLANLYRSAVKELKTPCTSNAYETCSCCTIAGKFESLIRL